MPASVHAPNSDRQAPAFPDPIPGIIPFGTVTIFAGAPGVGKTAMLADWCARWRDGKTICDCPTNRPTAFYYLAADRQWASHAQWFALAGFPEIPYYSLADDVSFDVRQLVNGRQAHDHFLWCFNQLNPVPGSHVFVDPVSPLFIAGDPNRARDVAVSMLRFSRLSAERQINITCAAHFGKQKTDPKEQYTRPQDRIAGSGAFTGFSDTQIYLVDPLPPKQPYHILGWNPRHAPAEEFHFTRGTDGLFKPYNLYSELDRREAILNCVPYEPTSISIIYDAIKKTCGIGSTLAWKYLRNLLDEGRVIKLSKGIYQRAKPS